MTAPADDGRTCGRCMARILGNWSLCAGCELRCELQTTLDWAGSRSEWGRRMQDALDRYDDRCAHVSWTKVWSHVHERYYYWQRLTGLTRWEDPSAEEAASDGRAQRVAGTRETAQLRSWPEDPGDPEEDSGGTEGAWIGWDPSRAEPWLERPLATPARIGIDVGGVLKRYLDDGPRDPWELKTDAEVPGAMAALGKCIEHFGPDNVFTLSKCRGEMRKKIDAWLTRTMRVCEAPIGMRLENILYSETRYGPQGKGAVVERLQLQLSHFVDDHDDCLWSVYEEGQSQEHVERHEGRLFHMSRGGEGRWRPEPRGWKMEDRPACVTPVRNWDEVLWHLGLDRGQ